MKNHWKANAGVPRNKKPLENLVYKFEIKQIDFDDGQKERYKDCLFKDLGYLVYYCKLERSKRFGQVGAITVDKLKELLGEKQYAKFCEGKDSTPCTDYEWIWQNCDVIKI